MLDIRRFGAAFIVALALAGCGKSAGSVDDKLPENTSYKLAVMSFNVRNSLAKGDTGDKQWSNRREGVKKMIVETAPDIIGMQEASAEQRRDLVAMLPDFALLEVPNTGTSKEATP